ncbi:hypothetical protein [Shewanella maritima]|uniref:hypothetical protein n=1 Tax=Shewanella maritima TaxID=2520507 RepID=UPI003735BB70
MSSDNVTEQFEQWFANYLSLKLAAFDNAKVVVAVLSHMQQTYECYEVMLENDSVAQYAVYWQQRWILCGHINDYQCAFSLQPEDFAIQQSNKINIPIMSLNQVGFMCMESAHFDHC